MRRGRGAPRRRGAPRGFTLIELMVALVVSSLLVGMIFAIFLRISTAYRGQQQIAEVQGKLAAARARIEHDAKHAGLAIANGFNVGILGRVSPLRVINNADAPDEIAFYYADRSVRAAVSPESSPCTWLQCTRLRVEGTFRIGDIVVASTAGNEPSPYRDLGDANLAGFDACALEVTSVGVDALGFSTLPPWGSLNNVHCPGAPIAGRTVFYKLIANHWRIDPARPADGVLQRSPLGALVGVDDWEDQGYGFTDLQVATRLFEPADTVNDTPDPDTDPQRDWYSGEAQETETNAPSGTSVPLQVSISLVARTERDVEGIATPSTPSLTVIGNEDHNTIGDRPAVPLPSSDPALAGNRVLRYTTFQVDLRNLGVGR